MVRITIYEDNTSLRESLSQLISLDPGCLLAGAFQNALHIAEETEQLQPDVILLDIAMPGINGIEGLRRIRSQHPAISILMFTV